MIKNNLADFEKKIGIDFKNKDLLQQVFVHRSYLNENIGFSLDHNERLEFLGDAVLELIVTDYLYKKLPNPEGELTNLRSALVKGRMLSDIAQSLNINDYLYLSKGEAKSGGKARQIILANTLEALVGAIYLDQGYEQARVFLEKYLINKLSDIINQKLYLDPKSHLQELSQAHFNITPTYRVLTEYGPDHDKSFTVGCFLNDKLIGEGSGSSKQAAESAAASSATEHWDEIRS
ncbi:ribonuclease III [Candidatus Berkelbacteria bacterium RBG_13_40_8]|uniref:Ribonuclease 3 n=1 Tax=Candidatus Berkelbacteria bacterium RBG_13_40_8 TaxID=1797467 RepID=A0A1F5DQI3_9BACT|nr:MAG: ribonuclease III [Candidatus Berkelbacteria bacterium RBG_13_40_8]